MPAPYFGANLCYLRRRLSWTQGELATRLGPASHTFLSHLETGRKALALDLALRLADYFGVSVASLLGRADVPEDQL